MNDNNFSSFNILVTDNVHPILVSSLRLLAKTCDYKPKIDRKSVLETVHRYQGIVINTKIKADKELIDKAKNLKFIARLGSGLDIIDLDYAQKKDIAVINSPEGNRNAVAEHMLGMLLCLSNKLISAHREVLKKQWDREAHRGFEIIGKTIGIYGCGHTGSSFAKKLRGLDVNVLLYDKYKQHFDADLRFATVVNREEILRQSDILSFHLPLTPETKHLVNQKFLAKCTPGVILLNSSRGAVIHTESLLNALKSGTVGGACLDVFENEKPSTRSPEEQTRYQQLTQLPQVVCSPHVAGWTHESKEKIARILLKKLKELYQF